MVPDALPGPLPWAPTIASTMWQDAAHMLLTYTLGLKATHT